MADSDAELMSRYCTGDASAFRELYERVAPRLLNYLLRMAGQRSVAEDMLQLTFLKVHRARGAYVDGAAPLPWLYAIAHRTFLDEVRRRKRSNVELSRDGDHMPEGRAHVTGAPEAEVHEPVHDPELARAALAALEELPPNQREALVLTKLSGKSIAEAAAITGATPGAMKVRAHRGYVALRKALAQPAADLRAEKGGRS
ncbi:MAG TPA: RNA polymerase sigma factor [Kofleriaceae bacterium]|nr:RNA polymerase sigma factor [Kofleriaceae bacterium]